MVVVLGVIFTVAVAVAVAVTVAIIVAVAGAAAVAVAGAAAGAVVVAVAVALRALRALGALGALGLRLWTGLLTPKTASGRPLDGPLGARGGLWTGLPAPSRHSMPVLLCRFRCACTTILLLSHLPDQLGSR